MKIFAGSDHAGFELRSKLVEYLRTQGHEVIDWGPSSAVSSDYPDYAAPVARAVRDNPGTRGLLVCSSGVGVSVVANKIRGIQAVNAWNLELARLARAHNNATVLCIGQKFIAEVDARAIVDTFLTTAFEEGRHTTRVAKVASVEATESVPS